MLMINMWDTYFALCFVTLCVKQEVNFSGFLVLLVSVTFTAKNITSVLVIVS
jgi:hypothetical protein